ncbi:GNAT family N-acetyltransferase [Actinoplanes sp. NPDC051851]|uniref:GNAT family N-acetyltransferase n=1 Tax=Actinoplanes sp. NPDC051851 TaxID=3154753 RepID=UPI003432E148
MTTRPGASVPGKPRVRTFMLLRTATPADSSKIADLHADSWRRHYRGAYSDTFLDGDVAADRRTVWSARLAAPTGSVTIVAEQGDHLTGFVHLVIDHDPVWGSLVDNLHVAHDQHRNGIGTGLLTRAAGAAGGPIHLWVLRQNTAAQRFYRAVGGQAGETALVAPPGGDPARLHGSPEKLRMSWPDPASLVAVTATKANDRTGSTITPRMALQQLGTASTFARRTPEGSS